MNLAAALAAAARDNFAAESAVVDLLYEVLPGWRLLFPSRRSWLWTPPDAIDVWSAPGDEAAIRTAVRALLGAGFVGGVTLHGHAAEKFLSCRCTPWRPKPRVDPRTQ